MTNFDVSDALQPLLEGLAKRASRFARSNFSTLVRLLQLTLFMAATSATAESMLVQSGSKSGQAYAFEYEPAKGCIAVTAAHVIADASADAPILLFGIGGESFTGEVIALDRTIDVAVLQVLVNGKRTYRRSPESCRAGGPIGQPRQITHGRTLLEDERARVAWIDRVATPAGGLDRVFAAGRFSYESDRIRFQVPRNSYVSQGDSGAPVWIDFGSRVLPNTDERMLETASSRFAAVSPNVRRRGTKAYFLGLVGSINDGGVVLIPPETINAFVVEAFAPGKFEGVRVDPEHVRVVKSWRGPMGPLSPRTRGSPGFFHSLSGQMIGLELDLGARDVTLHSVQIEYAKPPDITLRTDRRTRWWYPVRVLADAYRPGERTDAGEGGLHEGYEKVECDSGVARPTELNTYVVSCRIQIPRVVRALALTVVGDVENVLAVSLETN